MSVHYMLLLSFSLRFIRFISLSIFKKQCECLSCFSFFLFVSTNVHVVKHVFMSLCVNVYKSISANSFKWLSMCMNLCTCRCFILSTKTHIYTHICIYTHIQPLTVLSLFSFSIVNTNTHTLMRAHADMHSPIISCSFSSSSPPHHHRKSKFSISFCNFQ